MRKRNPTYISWCSMRNRVLSNSNPNDKIYKDKKIKICNRWLNSFSLFLEDMGERLPDTTLDRINNDGNYEPNNCRWATKTQQNNNKSNNVFIKYKDMKKTIGEWSLYLKVSEKEKERAYRRYNKQKCRTVEELFIVKDLTQYYLSKRINKCEKCNADESSTWFKKGKLCSSCYQKQWRRKNNEKRNT